MIDILTPVVLQTGLACIAAQGFFYVLFAYILPKGPWTDMPGFTAHQAVAFPLMGKEGKTLCENIFNLSSFSHLLMDFIHIFDFSSFSHLLMD